jgi:hypothetical protein
MNSRLFLSRIPILTGLIFVLVACNQAPLSSALPTPTKAPLSLSPTMTATSPEVASTTLGKLPQDCLPGPIQKDISSNFGPAVGADPVWVGAGNFRKQPPLALIWDQADASHNHNQYGWEHKFLYVVATRYQGVVTIQGANLSDHSPLYPDAQDAELTSTLTSLVLDTRNPTIANRNDQWTQFPGGLTVPKAGCYSLEAIWSGGSWRITFAAGLVSS